MAVVDNVIKLKPRTDTSTKISIEEADESWALALLAEHEDLDESAIEVEDQPYSSEQLCVQQTDINAANVYSDPERANTCEDQDVFGADMLALTAIDQQMLAQAKKQSELSLVKDMPLSLFSRLKAVLNYDLLNLIR